MKALDKVRKAAETDPKLLVDKAQVDNTLGFNPDYLLDLHGITKSDLIRLERVGLAMKARYETRHPKQNLIDKLNEAKRAQDENAKLLTCPTGTHRVRWILFTESN